MPKANGAATELAPLLDGSTAGELIPELVRRGLQQLIELEVAAVLTVFFSSSCIAWAAPAALQFGGKGGGGSKGCEGDEADGAKCPASVA